MMDRPRKLLAVAGIAGPLFFTTLVVAQGIWQPDYSHVEMPISAAGMLSTAPLIE